MEQSQCLKMRYGNALPLYFSLLALFDRNAEEDSIGLLKTLLAKGSVTDPVAEDVLRSICAASDLARSCEH
jgi:hypothetical protein